MAEKLEGCRKQLIVFSEKVASETKSDQAAIFSLTSHNEELKNHLQSVFDSFKEMSWSSVAAGSSLQYENPDNYLGKQFVDCRQPGVPVLEHIHLEDQRIHGGSEEPQRST